MKIINSVFNRVRQDWPYVIMAVVFMVGIFGAIGWLCTRGEGVAPYGTISRILFCTFFLPCLFNEDIACSMSNRKAGDRFERGCGILMFAMLILAVAAAIAFHGASLLVIGIGIVAFIALLFLLTLAFADSLVRF